MTSSSILKLMLTYWQVFESTKPQKEWNYNTILHDFHRFSRYNSKMNSTALVLHHTQLLLGGRAFRIAVYTEKVARDWRDERKWIRYTGGQSPLPYYPDTYILIQKINSTDNRLFVTKTKLKMWVVVLEEMRTLSKNIEMSNDMEKYIEMKIDLDGYEI